MDAVIVVHAVAASFVLALGPVNILRRRRDAAHRIIGRVYVAAMVLTCVSSFGIRSHGFSWLHGLATFTLFAMAMGVYAIRHGRVGRHRFNMVGAYLGTLTAFVFAALTPNRLLARMIVHDGWSLLAMALLVLATAGSFCLATIRLNSVRRVRLG